MIWFAQKLNYGAVNIKLMMLWSSEEVSVALIKSIVVKKQTIFAVVRKYEVVQNYLRLFESTSMSTDLHLINLETLQDSYPLFRRGTEKKFILIPHHHISFSYD